MTVEQELADLKRRLAARGNQPGFKANVEALKYRIAELEAKNAG